MGIRWYFVAVILCFISAVSSGPDERGKSVIVSVNAKWTMTSLIAETSEFIARENNESFWKFISNIAEKCESLSWIEMTTEKKYEFALKQASSILGESAMDLLKFTLSLRTFSPAVQLFQQIGSEYSIGKKCSAFFDVNGITGCSVDDLEKAVNSRSMSMPSLLSVDHVFGPSKDSPVIAIIYGDLGSPDWLKLHKKAIELARENKSQYVLRHFFNESSVSEYVSLSGYGVELAIKNTEYKAEDDSTKKKEELKENETNIHGFNFELLKYTLLNIDRNLHFDMKDSLELFKMHLKEIEELAPLKLWQVQDLSYQAAQRIVKEEPHNAIGLLKDLSQNFPLHARSLARESVSNDLRKEVENNQKESFSDAGVDIGESALFLNGINLDVDSLDMFQLIDILKQEEKLSTGFFNMGFRREYLSILVGMELSDEKISYAVDYRDAYPFFLNNLDSDKQYKQWGNTVKLMLQPYYPGMIRPIARNLFTLIFVVDPSEKESRNLMKIAYSFYQHEIPLRIGIVFAVNNDKSISGKEDVGVAVLNLFNFIAIDSSNREGLKTVNKMLDIFRNRDSFNADDIKAWFQSNYHDVDYEDVFGINSDYDKGRQVGTEFIERTAIGKAPKVLLNGFILDEAGIKSDKFEETVMMEVMRLTPKIQAAVLDGRLKDRSNVANWLLEQKDVMPRLNKRVLDAPLEKKYLDLTDVIPCRAKVLSQFIALTDSQKAQCIIEKTKYLKKSDNDYTMSTTLWIVADLETTDGRKIVYNSIKHLKHSKNTRVGIIMNPYDEVGTCKPNSISSLVQAATRLLPRTQAKQFITKLVKEEIASGLLSGKTKLEDLAVGGMNMDHFNKERNLLSCDKIKMEGIFATTVLNLNPGVRAVVANGMIIGPLDSNESLEESDFALLEKMMEARGAAVIVSHVDKWEVEKENDKASNVVLRSAALIGKHAVARKRTWVVLTGDEHSSVTLVADDEKRATMDIIAVVDPLSTSTQKLAPILELLRKTINCDLKIVMNPKAKLSELPLKRFYRYVAAPELQFDHNGNLALNQARFSHLPSKQLLTLSVHSPDAWMVENVYAEYDLDNIKMDQVSSDVLAIFSLEHILLEGHCFDEVSGSPPRGLQFVLGTSSNPDQFDTIVMANLGYFQLKANPGAWILRLREGKSKDIYQIASHVNTEGHEGDIVRVLIDSFSGRTIRVRVSKKEGMEERNLLSDDIEESGGIWSSLSNRLVGEKYDIINVFSLASGHLYERFMRIMILSVMKQTKRPVKFWLLKNYLSPQFKETLPIMAAEYGFDYALVEYKWPRWLHQQKEKHRIMWGYKILFLDVLFPLDVQKIIFVDADQVVKADLMELMEFDLDGAPYGYVPFCDSRKEMDGFRFWKQGYWANHLAGRRYHISALYVIDLQKFRQIAAGDRLRGQYQGLSSDPNSLSNLDQVRDQLNIRADLPNNMIHQVKIKSLPQEWLWCETWCDDGSKTSAKTIDLCNNPLTKEPKLESATRIIPEWNDYDAEIKRIISRKRSIKNLDNTKVNDHNEL